jgi:hypothetical protein
MTRGQFVLFELAIVVISSALIVLAYVALAYLLPGTATYAVLLTGVALSAVLGALAARAYRRDARRVAWAAYLGAGVAVGVLVLFLSTGTLVSLMGS